MDIKKIMLGMIVSFSLTLALVFKTMVLNALAVSAIASYFTLLLWNDEENLN